MKKFRLLLALVVVALVATVCCACPANNEPEHTFTVTIYDVDGTPCTWIDGIQLCQVSDGGVAMCYTPTGKVDENGVAYLDHGDDALTQIPSSATTVEVHLQGLPSYYTFDKLVMNAGESKTINLRYKTDAELDQFASGSGVATYLAEDATKIDTANGFDPYIANNMKCYRLKFTEENQKIYYSFTASYADDYKVYVAMGLNVKITQLSGNVTDGIVNSGEASKSVDGADCVYTFSASKDQTFYFEVSLNGGSVNTDAVICFDYAAN